MNPTRPALAALVLTASAALPLGASAPATPDVPTWSGDVAPVVHRNCTGCHRPGQIGPMALRTWEEARPWAKSIAKNVETKTMPPWHASGGTARFRNDRSLSQDEVDTIVRWAQGGAPAGDLAAAPSPPQFPSGEWQLGEPDLVITLDQVKMPAGGADEFPKLIGQLALPEDRWLTAIEVLPGNPKIVHHVIAFTVKGFDVDPEGGWLGAWAAGTEPMVFPKGTGRLIEKGANLLADMHLHAADTEQTDRTRIGLHFAAPGEEIEKELTNTWVINDDFEIPAGAQNHEVRASHTFWQGGKIMTLAPHMHYRGKNFKYLLTHPDGRQEELLRVDRWDFNWQTFYVLDPPIEVGAGARLDCIAHFDNSTDNAANPDPTKNVSFGNESFNEMRIGFLDFVVDDGVRPLDGHALRIRKLEELTRAHPGEVYKITSANLAAGELPKSYAPLYLPRAGEGRLFLLSNDQMVETRVHSIVWQNDSFTARIDASWGAGTIEGKLEGGKFTGAWSFGERTSNLSGERAGP